ncbi:hydrolase [Emticicia aquatilis]|uniref:Hydrolase n=1 Tax=Emticicia aquatilis TaxID=1537369 RepID=A0A916YTG0_9BACT|nr:carbon-nitrogen hydrolase family protein [Emticicia aquatilis]GGD59503.1 hydrolase [Emticicia aquatilis]
MKLCSAQIQPIKGDIERNIQKHVSFINLAVENGANLIFFPELSLTGYEPTLANELATTQEDSRLAIFQEISDTKKIIICVGIPTQYKEDICISMVIFQPHTSRQTYSKQILHADEYPYFVNGEQQALISYKSYKIAPAICFESLQIEHSANAATNGANIYLVSVAKSAKGVEKANLHYPKISQNLNLTVLMANSVGPADDFVSTGNSAVWNNEGTLLTQLDDTHEGIIIYDIETQKHTTQIY